MFQLSKSCVIQTGKFYYRFLEKSRDKLTYMYMYMYVGAH